MKRQAIYSNNAQKLTTKGVPIPLPSDLSEQVLMIKQELDERPTTTKKSKEEEEETVSSNDDSSGKAQAKGRGRRDGGQQDPTALLPLLEQFMGAHDPEAQGEAVRAIGKWLQPLQMRMYRM